MHAFGTGILSFGYYFGRRWLSMQIYPDQNGFELEHQKKQKQKQAPTMIKKKAGADNLLHRYSPHKCFIKTNEKRKM